MLGPLPAYAGIDPTYGVSDLAERVAAVEDAEVDRLVKEYEESYDVVPALWSGRRVRPGPPVPPITPIDRVSPNAEVSEIQRVRALRRQRRIDQQRHLHHDAPADDPSRRSSS